MYKQFIYLLISIFFNLNASAILHSEHRDSLINDGPYFSFTDNGLKVKWIENSELSQSYIFSDNFNKIKKKFGLSFSYYDLKQVYFLRPKFKQSYSRVDSIGIITDIHGEYNTYIHLLKSSGIIDKDLNWKFGKGHLVVLGDIFDRGSMVTEILWHLFGLEKQAEKAGGMVHVLLGNHEFLVLSKDLSYINEKYVKVEQILNSSYDDLYSDSTVLGKWLRSKPVLITINDILFVHAGISTGMIRRNLNIEEINRKFSNEILGKDPALFNKDEELVFLNENNGPLWYRGYFKDTSFCESKIDSVLKFYGEKHIVVGHTVNKEVQSFFNNKILGVDTGIMLKQPGEMLLYKDGSFYKSLATGKRIKL